MDDFENAKLNWARFSKVPNTFRARKAICEIANRLFWKSDLLTCFQGNKNKNNCEVWRIKCSPFLSYKGNCDTRKWPVKFRDFWETAPRTSTTEATALVLDLLHKNTSNLKYLVQCTFIFGASSAILARAFLNQTSQTETVSAKKHY